MTTPPLHPSRHAALDEQITHLSEQVRELLAATPPPEPPQPPSPDPWQRWGRWIGGVVAIGGVVTWVVTQTGFISITPREAVGRIEARVTVAEKTLGRLDEAITSLQAAARFSNTVLCRQVKERELVDQCAVRGLRAAPERP